MVVTFFQKRKTQRNLILVFIAVLLITTSVLWFGVFRREKPSASEEAPRPFKKVEIDYGVLKNPILKELQIFEKIPPFEEKAGRINPFLPY